MLPISTVQGVKDGISTGMIIDLSEYLKKTEGVSKEEHAELENVVANKLDATPQHNHHIEDIKQLQNVLNGKYDKSEKYSYNVILNDSEKIPFFENPKMQLIEIVPDRDSDGYTFYVDEKSGDLMIVFNSVLIGSYSKAGNKWLLKGMEPENYLAQINSKITELENVLQNHYQALMILCEKHDMVDTNTDDGSNITPNV